MTDIESFYSQRKQIFSEQLAIATKQINLISTLRLITAGVFIVLLYAAFSKATLFYFLPIIILLFVILVTRHSALFDKKKHLENLVIINSNEIQSVLGNFSCFDAGSEFIDPHHPYSHDLDIFGKGSLYQYINRSSTTNGAKQLAALLSNPLHTAPAIEAQQLAVKELTDSIDFRQNFLATGMSLEEFPNDKQQLLSWAERKSFIFGKGFYHFILRTFPAVTAVLILASVFIDGIFGYVILWTLLQWIFLGFHLKAITAFHQDVSYKKNILKKYARLLHLFSEEKVESVVLKNLSAKAQQAHEKVKSLALLVNAFDARLNFLMNIFVNSLLLYDLQCVYRLEKWKEENAFNLKVWMDLISEIDVLCSLATFKYNHKDFNFPTITQERKIVATNMGHPLLSKKECVTNNVHIGLEQSIMIITGANMAGKSTFLRTLGVNMVLALSGAPVCATAFTCAVISMRSGMRTADSLQDHQSYFYAELNRLKSIMDELRSGKPLLILLDEILKGTNSTDKQAGSIALVKQLLSHPCLAIIATHDLALGDLEQQYPAKVINYCFEPTIENDQLSFDYKLKPGLAQKMNATFLMKKMGIIPE